MEFAPVHCEVGYARAIVAIDDMGSLKRGWDRDDALRVVLGARETAIALLQRLRVDRDIQPPQVAATPDGRIDLAWRSPTEFGTLEVEALCSGNGSIRVSIGYRERRGLLFDEAMTDVDEVARQIRDSFEGPDCWPIRRTKRPQHA